MEKNIKILIGFSFVMILSYLVYLGIQGNQNQKDIGNVSAVNRELRKTIQQLREKNTELQTSLSTVQTELQQRETKEHSLQQTIQDLTVRNEADKTKIHDLETAVEKGLNKDSQIQDLQEQQNQLTLDLQIAIDKEKDLTKLLVWRKAYYEGLLRSRDSIIRKRDERIRSLEVRNVELELRIQRMNNNKKPQN